MGPRHKFGKVCSLSPIHLHYKEVIIKMTGRQFSKIQNKIYSEEIAGFQTLDTFSAWWSTPNGNTVVGTS